jgi:hypothetical protein
VDWQLVLDGTAAAISKTEMMRRGSQSEAIGASSFALRDQPIDSQTNSELRCVCVTQGGVTCQAIPTNAA